MEMLVYVPVVTPFMSSRVCSPLNRAKSIVGVPLTNCTVVLLAVVAEMLSIGTVNEVTLAVVTGASVPTTKDEPVIGVDELVTVLELLPQPAANNATAAREMNAIGN